MPIEVGQETVTQTIIISAINFIIDNIPTNSKIMRITYQYKNETKTLEYTGADFNAHISPGFGAVVYQTIYDKEGITTPVDADKANADFLNVIDAPVEDVNRKLGAPTMNKTTTSTNTLNPIA